jgi:hypothetical protein
MADTAAWNRAIAYAAPRGRPVLGRGTYILQVSPTPDPTWQQAPYPAHIAVRLQSNSQIVGRDLTFCVAPPDSVTAPLARHFLFGTELNRQAGALHDIGFENVRFDFREEWGAVHPYTYAVGLTGVDRLIRRNLQLVSTGRPAGRGLLSHNVRGRSDERLRHRNIVQGTFTRNEHGVKMHDIEFDGFVEALDFDGPCWDVTLTGLRFRNGRREAQCIDTAGGSDWMVDDVVATDVGAIIFLYDKVDGWPNYDQWLTGFGRPAKDSVPLERVTVSNVVGLRAGYPGAEAIRIGNLRNHKWPLPQMKSLHDVTLRHISLRDSYHILINEGENLDIRDIDLHNIRTPDDAETGAALAVREQTRRPGKPDYGSRISGSIGNIRIENSDGMGLSAIAGPDLHLSDIHIDGYNQSKRRLTAAGIRRRPARGGPDMATLSAASALNGGGATAVDDGRPDTRVR